jgi:hypothetical protein
MPLATSFRRYISRMEDDVLASFLSPFQFYEGGRSQGTMNGFTDDLDCVGPVLI